MRIRFIRGKACAGRDYSPGDVAEIDDAWARRFVASGAAVREDGEPLPPAPTLTTASLQHGDPVAEHRDPAEADAPPESPTRGRGRGRQGQ